MKKAIISSKLTYNNTNIVEQFLKSTDEFEVALAIVNNDSERDRLKPNNRVIKVVSSRSGEMFNLDSLEGLDYAWLEEDEGAESDFCDGFARFAPDYQLLKYRYIAAVNFWEHFFKDNKIDLVIVEAFTEGGPEDSLLLFIAKKYGVACYSIDNVLTRRGAIYCYNDQRYVALNHHEVEYDVDSHRYYNTSFISESKDKNLIRKRIKDGIYTTTGAIGARFLDDLFRRHSFIHKIKNIDGSESTFFEYYSNYRIAKKVKRYLKQLSTDVSLDENYIIYYLHYEPEAVMQVRCTLKSQLAAIKMLSEALPKGWKLYVKEHPHQFRLNREDHWFYLRTINNYKNPRFYDFISKLENTYIVNPDFPSKELTAHARCVSTFLGTVAVEAASDNKPVLLFGSERTILRECKDYICIRKFEELTYWLDLIENGWVPNYDDLNTKYNLYSFMYDDKKDFTDAIVCIIEDSRKMGEE